MILQRQGPLLLRQQKARWPAHILHRNLQEHWWCHRRRRISETCFVSTIKESLLSSSSSLPEVNDNDNKNYNNPNHLRIYNSLSQKLEPLIAPLPTAKNSSKGLAWYTCGPTVYAPAHLGHARTYVCLDIVRRVLEHYHHQQQSNLDDAVPTPLFVLNITDVDDKILAAANESGQQAPLDLARHYEAEFWKDWDALNCLRPHVVTRVTEHVASSIVPYIQQIMLQHNNLLTYVIAGDGVYFNVRAFEHKVAPSFGSRYGKLAPPPQAVDLLVDADTFSNSRQPEQQQHEHDQNEAILTLAQKMDARDFCLWKFRKPGEAMYWNSPWGEGRPGWHIECSAMIQAVQEQFANSYQFAVHAGGMDLKFPHHTNEIAQAEAFAKQEWIPTWVHTGHLHIHGMKMSKSLKNFITIQELLALEDGSAWSSPADDFRLWCLGLAGSYRGLATYTPDRITEARKMRCEKLCQFLHQGQEWIRQRQTHDSCDTYSNKRWDATDVQLFKAANQTSRACIQALYLDLDGTTFVEQLVDLAEKGFGYMRRRHHQTSSKEEEGEEERMQPQPPEEPMRHVLQTVRDLLELVGFSRVTVKAGLLDADRGVLASGSSGVLGGEQALLDEMVQFRKAVRDAALSLSSSTSSSSGDSDKNGRWLKMEILRLCDEVRESVFPALGVELRDGRHSDDNDDRGQTSSSWSYSIPRKPDTTGRAKEQEGENSTTAPTPRLDLRQVSVEDFFRVGQYKDMFSAFDETGFPTHDAKGNELSKTMRNKLSKKRQVHKKKLEQQPASR